MRDARTAAASSDGGAARSPTSKILDLMWVMAGPAATRVLADYGATVVRVESTRRIDIAGRRPHTAVASRGGELGLLPEPQCRQAHADARPHAAGRPRVILDLVAWADVVTESFSPGTMTRWGLDYPALAPSTGHHDALAPASWARRARSRSFAGFGNLAAAIAGFSNLGGWPDRPPAGPFSAYTDYVSPRFIAAAILAALDHRRRTG